MIALQSLIERAARLNGESVATNYKGTEKSWNETQSRVGSLAAGLQSLGLSEGDRVGILSLNCANYYEALFAVPWAGFCVVPLNTRWAVRENEYAISDSGTRVVLFAPKPAPCSSRPRAPARSPRDTTPAPGRAWAPAWVRLTKWPTTSATPWATWPAWASPWGKTC